MLSWRVTSEESRHNVLRFLFFFKLNVLPDDGAASKRLNSDLLCSVNCFFRVEKTRHFTCSYADDVMLIVITWYNPVAH